MALYCWKENVLQIYRDGDILEIAFPECTSGVPVCSRTERYIAVPGEKKLFVYDSEQKTVLTLPHKQFFGKNTAVRFDAEDKVLSFHGNEIFCHDLVTKKSEKLYHAGRSPYNPQNTAVSPKGRYISYCRYRSADLRLYVYDRQSGQCLDPKFSVYHYAWLSETQIAYSLKGGIKVLDVQTGKSVTLLRDHRAVAKRCARKEDADILRPYCTPNEEFLFADLDLMRVCGDRIFFGLWLFPHGREPHYGIWSSASDGTDTRWHYKPRMTRQFADPYSFLTRSGKFVYWADHKRFLFDGTTAVSLSEDWREMPCFDSPGR